MAKLIEKAYLCGKKVYKKAKNDELYGIAGHSSLFLVISFFPLVLLIISLLQYTHLNANDIEKLLEYAPSINNSFASSIKEIFEGKSVAALSISAISLVWSASASIFSIMRGLNHVYEKKETRNYFLVRASAIVYTLLFVISLIITLGLLVFGSSIFEMIASFLPFLKELEFITILFGKTVAFLLIVMLFDLLYTLIPNRPSLPLFELPGALFSAFGWYAFSFFYSLYIDNFSRLPSLYGSIAAIVLLLVWLYFCMYIFFLGAELNIVLEEEGAFKKRREAFHKKLSERKKKKNEKQKIYSSRS